MNIVAVLYHQSGETNRIEVSGDNLEWDSHQLWEKGYDYGLIYAGNKLIAHVLFTT